MTFVRRKFLLLLSAVCLLGGNAFGDIINIGGNALGSFTSPLPGLSFSGTTFNTTTNLAGNSFGVNMGTFSLQTPCLLCVGAGSTNFNATVNIATPTGTTPGSQTQQARVTGVVLFGLGAVSVNFNTPAMNFAYSNSAGSGSFTISLRNLSLTDWVGGLPSTAALRADITNAVFNPGQISNAAPEPSSIALLLIVVAGVGYSLKRRIAVTN